MSAPRCWHDRRLHRLRTPRQPPQIWREPEFQRWHRDTIRSLNICKPVTAAQSAICVLLHNTTCSSSSCFHSLFVRFSLPCLAIVFFFFFASYLSPFLLRLSHHFRPVPVKAYYCPLQDVVFINSKTMWGFWCPAELCKVCSVYLYVFMMYCGLDSCMRHILHCNKALLLNQPVSNIVFNQCY